MAVGEESGVAVAETAVDVETKVAVAGGVAVTDDSVSTAV